MGPLQDWVLTAAHCFPECPQGTEGRGWAAVLGRLCPDRWPPSLLPRSGTGSCHMAAFAGPDFTSRRNPVWLSSNMGAISPFETPMREENSNDIALVHSLAPCPSQVRLGLGLQGPGGQRRASGIHGDEEVISRGTHCASLGRQLCSWKTLGVSITAWPPDLTPGNGPQRKEDT